MTSAKLMLLLSAALIGLFQSVHGINVAAFNIKSFGDAKVNALGPDIVKVIKNYDIVLVQEVRDVDLSSVNKLKNLLGSTVWDFLSSSPIGRTTYKEQYVFYYKKAVVKILGTFQYDDSAQDVFEREPFSVAIQYKSLSRGKNVTVVLLGIHTQPDRALEELQALPTTMTAAKSKFPDAAGVIAIGDFNADCSYLTDAEELTLSIFQDTVRYRSLIPDTADSTSSTNTDCAYDRIIIEGGADIVADSAKVYRYDTALGIPLNTTTAISDHYPVDFILQ